MHEGLESTLVMLNHKLKHTHIKVKRDYDKSLPKLTMHGSELNQVWTNLLDNAIGALGEDGTITITTLARERLHQGRHRRRRAGHPGRRPRTRVFDPFFTTKAPGSGTGMGLDTARRIVEQRHGGSLASTPATDGTTFHVWLPLDGVEEMTRCSHLDHDRDHRAAARRSRAARTAWPTAASGCTCASAWTCGHVGCCDDSPSKHASAHARERSTRSSARSSRARTGAGASRTRSGC